MDTTAHAQIKFNLQPPTYYFKNPASLALLQAALHGDQAKARELVAEGANPNDEGPMLEDKNAGRLRLLHYAIAAGNKQAVQTLISVGADPELNVQSYGRAFLFALTLNNVEMLALLLDLRPINTLSERTLKILLFRAASENRSRCLELLLQRGAPIDFPDGAGYTILMRAMNGQDFDLVEHLLQLGASVNIVTLNGVTPAYQVQRMLPGYIPGSPTYIQLEHIKKLMEERGVTFPTPEPEEVRARREANGK